MVQDVNIGDCIVEGWQYYKKHIWLALGTLIVYIVIVVVGSLIPILGFVFSVLVTPALGGGLFLFFLNVARDTNPAIEDLFGGFQRYGTLIGLNFLTMAIGLICAIPIIGFVCASVIGQAENQITQWPDPRMIMLIFVLVVGVFLMLYRYWLVWWVIMDDPRLPLFDALSRSSQITRGNGANLILLMIASFGIALLLTLALIIPVLIFGPMLYVAHARFYLKLKEMHEPVQPVVEIPPTMM